jgi:hypothetical protein
MIRDVIGKLGDFDVTLDLRSASAEVAEAIDHYDHIVVLKGHVPSHAVGDSLLAAARFVGVVRSIARPNAVALEVSGSSMDVWLGDEDGKGEAIETAVSFTAEDYDVVIRTLLPAAVTEGTISTTPVDTFTGSFEFTDPRSAIGYVSGLFNTFYRVNGDGTLDAGPAAELFNTTPTAVIARLGAVAAADDPEYNGTIGEPDLDRDGADITTRVVLVASPLDDAADAIATGEADLASPTTYKDIHGNLIIRTRFIEELGTSTGNADARAALFLNRFTSPRERHTLDVDDYDIDGDFAPGDTVYVYDPETGLSDLTNPVTFNGRQIAPVELQVQAATYPITDDLSVWHRDKDGVWTDLTDYVDTETGSTTIEVGDLPRSGVGGTGGLSRVYAGADTLAPNAPTITSAPATRILDNVGNEVARADITWTKPTNTDATTFDDGLHYIVRHKPAAESNWTTFTTPIANLTALVDGLLVDTLYDFELAAVDTAGNTSAWSATTQSNTGEDSTPPNTPAVATVASSPLQYLIQHDLTDSGAAALADDLDHLEIHVGTSAGFTPSSSTLEAKTPASFAMIALGVNAITTVPREDASIGYIKVIAVDKTGNASTASASASSSATLIDTAQIANLAVDTAQIANLAVNTAQIANLAVDTGQIALLAVDTAQIAALAVDTAQIANLAVDTAQIAALAVDTAQIAALAVTDAKIDTLTANKLTAGTVDASVITVTNLDASNISTGTLNASHIVAGSITITQMGTNSVDTNEIVNGAVGSAQMGTNFITSAHISSLSATDVTSGAMHGDRITGGTLNVTSAEIVNLDVSKLNAGLITGNTFRTASSGSRVDIGNLSGLGYITIYNGGNSGSIYCDPSNGIVTTGGKFTVISGGILASGSGTIAADGDLSTAGGKFISSAGNGIFYRSANAGGFDSSGCWSLQPYTASTSATYDRTLGFFGSRTSRRATKQNIINVSAASALARINLLEPADFTYDPDILADSNAEMAGLTPQRGLMAEETAAVDPRYVAHGWLSPEDPRFEIVLTPETPLEDYPDLADAVPVGIAWEAITTDLVGAVNALTSRLESIEALPIVRDS